MTGAHAPRDWRRWVLRLADLVLPVAVFARQIGLWTLDPSAAPRMMLSDWTTYIAAPNFLRGAPVFTFPLGRIPGYVSPPGINLAMADANPLLLPAYRVANALSPGRPVQLVGWQILLAYVVVFLFATRFVEVGAQRLRGSSLGFGERVVVRAIGAAALAMPFFSTRWVHVSLTNHWVVIAALHLALFRRRYTVVDVVLRVALLIVATLIQPYFFPMVAALTVPYVVGGLRRKRWWLAILVTVGALGATLAAARLFGFLGGGFQTMSHDYGSYTADLGSLLIDRGSGRLMPDLPGRGSSGEGLGFPGLGMLGLAAAGAVVVAARGLPRRVPRAAWGVLAAAGALAVFAALPRVRLFGFTLFDGRSSALGLHGPGQVFRTNGRFVWPLAWLVVLAAGAVVVAWRSSWTPAIVVALAVAQFADVPGRQVRPRTSTPYELSVEVLRAERAAGATAIELQPPWVLPVCFPAARPVFDEIAPTILAAAVLQLPINSGYTSRPSLIAKQEICYRQRRVFAARRYWDHVLYLLPAGTPAAAGLECRPMTSVLKACRAAGAGSG